MNKTKVIFFTNIPSPYRIDFFNEFSKYVDLTVIFEARRSGRSFNWNDNELNFNAIFLSDNLEEKRINWKILGYINKNEYDYYFLTNYANCTELLIYLKIKCLGIPYIMELDGAIPRRERLIKKTVKSFLIRGAAYYFSPSCMSDSVLRNYGVKQEKIIRYFFTSLKKVHINKKLKSTTEKKHLRRKLGITEEKVVICVGQFIYRKGNDVLINAAKSLYGNIGVYFIGGQVTDEYLTLVKKNGLTNIHFVGFQDNEMLGLYYDAADIFVLPTREDVWGLVINEAMAHGLPIITTDKCVAGVELVKDNGLIVPANDSKVLSDEINEIINDQQKLEEMGIKSLEYIEQYTIEKMVNQHLCFISQQGKKTYGWSSDQNSVRKF